MSKRGTLFYRHHIWTEPPDDPLTIMCGKGKRFVLPPVPFRVWREHYWRESFEQDNYCTCCTNAAKKILAKTGES